MHLKRLHRDAEVRKLLENLDPKIADILLEQSENLDKCIARITELEEQVEAFKKSLKSVQRVASNPRRPIIQQEYHEDNSQQKTVYRPNPNSGIKNS